MRVSPIPVVLLAALFTGCVEDKQAAKEPPKEVAEKASAVPEKASGPSRRTVSIDGPDTGDPALLAARMSSTQVAEREERIDAALTALSEEVRSISAKDHRAVDLTAERLLNLVQTLRKSGERVIERYPKTKTELAALVKSSAHVAIAFRRAKESCREKAELETGQMRNHYLDLAQTCDALIRANNERAQKYRTFADDLDRAVAKVERHIQFFSDYEQILLLNPGISEAKSQEEFIETLNRFADQIQKLGGVLTEFRDKVREGATSKKLRDEHESALAKQTEAVPQMLPPREPPAPAVPEAVAERPAPREKEQTRQDEPARPATTHYAPVTITRFEPVLVPVRHYATCGCLFRRTTLVTHYEWRNRVVTETVYAPVGQ